MSQSQSTATSKHRLEPGHYDVVVVGGGQAGLSVSHYLQQASIGHIVFEEKAAMHAWRERRWDTFCLVTPNWQCALPGHSYSGPDPHAFMTKDEVVEYLDEFVVKVNAPLREGTRVSKVVRRKDGRYVVKTSAGVYSAEHVVVASGAFHTPVVPRMAERLPSNVKQLHSSEYRNARSLPKGSVLVVGSGQSGAQIAEDLHLAGRQVFLAVSGAPRCARRYRGRDIFEWMADLYAGVPVERHPLGEGVRDSTNNYLTGRDGGRDIDLRQFALEGMELFGHLYDYDGRQLKFKPNLMSNLDAADNAYNRINVSIDEWVDKHGIEAPEGGRYRPIWCPSVERETLDLVTSGITSVIWCIGYRPDFRWIEAPAFNGRGDPVHYRGITPHPGLYFVGLPWLHTAGSGRFLDVARDAKYIVDTIASSHPRFRSRAERIDA